MPSNWMFLVTQKFQVAPDSYPHSESVPEKTEGDPRDDVEHVLEVGDESDSQKHSLKWREYPSRTVCHHRG